MDYYDKNIAALKESLRDNLFIKLQEEVKDVYILGIGELIQGSTKLIEQELGLESNGLRMVIEYDDSFSIRAEIFNDVREFRGSIHISNLVIIAMYELFFKINLDGIVLNSIQEGVVRNLLFNILKLRT